MPANKGVTVQCAAKIDGEQCPRWIIPGAHNYQDSWSGKWFCAECYERGLLRLTRDLMREDEPIEREYE